jgi:hypothetical protein
MSRITTSSGLNLEYGEETHDIGWAYAEIKANRLVGRLGWNGKGVFIFLVAGSTFQVNRAPLNAIFKEGFEVKYNAHTDVHNADGSISTWAPSSSDAISTDWVSVQLVD